MKSFLGRYWYVVLITLIGVSGGIIYWHMVGCNSHSCPITSNWHTSALFGGLMGFFTADILRDLLRKKKADE